MKKTILALFLGLFAIATISSTTYAAGKPDIKAGFLRCDVEGSISFIFGSSKNMSCRFEQANGTVEKYTGKIKKYGVDIGYTKSGVMIWAVLAGTEDVERGALKGDFIGVSADAAVGVGLGANVLVLGGDNPKVALQPLSVEGIEGINIAAGIASLELSPKN